MMTRVRNGTLRAVIYGRQSHGSERSIDQQREACRRDAQTEGYTIVADYSDPISASRYARTQRDEWPLLLADIAAGKVDVVVLWESSRGDRQASSWLAFLELCRQRKTLIRVTDHRRSYDLDVPRDWRTLAEDGTDSQYESEKSRQRLLRDAVAHAESGGANGPVPYGYQRFKDSTTGRFARQIEHPEQAETVRQIFTAVAQGHPIRAIVRDLDQRGIPSPGRWRDNDSGWTTEHIRDMVRRKTYLGIRVHRPKAGGPPMETRGRWDPLVSQELWRRANRVLDGYRAGAGAKAAEHVLSGIPTCAACGDRYYGRALAGGSRYNCKACGKAVDGADLEDRVLAYVLGRLAQDDIHEQLRRVGDDQDGEHAAAAAELDRLTGELDEWRDSAAKGETTPATMARVESGYGERITRARARLERVSLPPAVRDLLDPREDLIQRWARMPVPARRSVVAALVTVSVKPGRRGVRAPIGQRVTVEWKGAG